MFQLQYNIANIVMQSRGCRFKFSKCYLHYNSILIQLLRGQCGIRGSWLSRFLKISVSPSFPWTVAPPIAPVKPCSVSLAASPLPPVCSISHTLCSGFQSCTQISQSLTTATTLWQNSSPAAHSSSSYSASSPLPACLLQPPLQVPAAGPQLPTIFSCISHYFFSPPSFLLPVSFFHLKPEAEFLGYFRVYMDFCLQRSKWFNTILWVSLYVRHIH